MRPRMVVYCAWSKLTELKNFRRTYMPRRPLLLYCSSLIVKLSMFACLSGERLCKVRANNPLLQILFPSLTLFNLSRTLLSLPFQSPAGLISESECKITPPFRIIQIFSYKSMLKNMYLTSIHNRRPEYIATRIRTTS